MKGNEWLSINSLPSRRRDAIVTQLYVECSRNYVIMAR